MPATSCSKRRQVLTPHALFEALLTSLPQEHFSKLKFNFLELQTKKKFLEALVDVTPENWIDIQPRGPAAACRAQEVTSADAEDGGACAALKAGVEAARAEIADHIDQTLAKLQQRDALLFQTEAALEAEKVARVARDQARAALEQQQAALGGVPVAVFTAALERETQARLDVQKGIATEEAAIAALEAELRAAQQAVDASRAVLEANERLWPACAGCGG